MHKFLCHYRIKNTDYCYKLCEACKGYYTKSKNFNSDKELIQYLTELNNNLISHAHWWDYSLPN